MMMTKRRIFPVILILFVLLTGCAIRLPKITATGERTAFENQIVGSYKMIEEQAWMVASLRASGKMTDSLEIAPGKRLVLEAILRQQFNADDIEEFKRREIVGEGNRGFIVIREEGYIALDSDYQLLVRKVVDEENSDREVIISRLLDLHPEIDPSESAKIGAIYARLKQEASPKGTWIQDENGEWYRK